MKLGEIVNWYQKKIGTYDKQPWEQSVEQRILNGFVNIPSKNIVSNTQYIDVDLVRGSTFPKAKPKQSLLTVIRLAVLRYLLFPLYAKWWVAQTSLRIFAFLLFLYVLQMVNWAIYSYHVNRGHSKANDSDTCSAMYKNDRPAASDTDSISITELLMPMSLSLLLSLIHSQIVATSSLNLTKADKAKKNPLQLQRKKRERRKRRKAQSRGKATANGAGGDVLAHTKPFGDATDAGKDFHSPISPRRSSQKSSEAHEPVQVQLQATEAAAGASAAAQLRKRNVNWCTSIKYTSVNYAALGTAMPAFGGPARSMDSGTGANDGMPGDDNDFESVAVAADDDGFESLNGKSSSGEEMSAIGGGASEAIGPAAEAAASAGQPTEAGPLNGGKDVDNHSGSNGTIISENNCDKMHMHNLLALKRARIVYGPRDNLQRYSSDDDDEEDDDHDGESSPHMSHKSRKADISSSTEWMGITTNSEDCSYSSAEHSESQLEYSENNGGEWTDYFTPTVLLNSNCVIGDKINCSVWDGREGKKTEMSVLDISSAIIKRVDAIPETCDYVYIGVVFSLVLSLVPAFCRFCEAVINTSESNEINFLDMPAILLERTSFSYEQTIQLAFGTATWQKTILVVDFVQRFSLTFLFFFLLAVAERTFKQRLLYAKLFSHLTSSRRARKSELPHFRLNKVRNIKTWLSVRSYLKRRGPQRSVDVIVSGAFILTLLLLAFLSLEWLKDSVQLQSQHTLEALIWSCALGCFLLRFMTLGTKINRKYRSISVLITEQINLYLQIEQKPHNKDELMVSNSVLKLAADLLKELESPFKISGLSANPYLYTTVKVVILSALSGVLSEMLGFKLKLHKIKIK